MRADSGSKRKYFPSNESDGWAIASVETAWLSVLSISGAAMRSLQELTCKDSGSNPGNLHLIISGM